MSDDLFSLKMRAACGEKHISGAERIVAPQDIASTLSALAKRALCHERGTPDSINLKVEAQDDVMRIKALPVFTETVADEREGWRRVEKLLAAALIRNAVKTAPDNGMMGDDELCS